MKNLLITIAVAALVGCSNAEVNITLIQAAKNGNIELVKSALDNGANVNAKDKRGNTALHFLAHNGHMEVIKVLFEAQANMNAKKNNGWTALMLAAVTVMVAMMTMRMGRKRRKRE